MKFSITYFFSICGQIRSFLQIWSHLLKKSVMENFIFCAVLSYYCIATLKKFANLKAHISIQKKRYATKLSADIAPKLISIVCRHLHRIFLTSRQIGN